MWISYAIVGLVLLGLGDFIKKLVLKNGGDKEVFLFMCFVFYLFALGVNYFLFSEIYISNHILVSALIVGFFDFLTPVGMLTALKYLDSSLSFVSIRLISSFLILYIGISMLGDSLSFYNIIGFLFGVVAIYFLSGFKLYEKHKINKKGVLAVIITIVGITGGHSYFKYIVDDIDIPSYMFFKFLFSFLFIILYMVIRKKLSNFSKLQLKKTSLYAFLSGIVFVTYFLYILPKIYILGPLSLSYKILSYSVIVPIILSILFLGEKITISRFIAFILTIISLFLFTI